MACERSRRAPLGRLVGPVRQLIPRDVRHVICSLIAVRHTSSSMQAVPHSPSSVLTGNAPRPPRRVAALDLGSNSFRLLLAQVEHRAGRMHVVPFAVHKETVRLAAGLGAGRALDAATLDNGIRALVRLGARLRDFGAEATEVVATSTLRAASNATDFVRAGEAVLGVPIRVVSGIEEARLIYLGAAQELPADQLDRLVIDIGGGSTECIIGRDEQALVLESAPVGCVTLNTRWFADGVIDSTRLRAARQAARTILAPHAANCRTRGWAYAVGTSGTAKALTAFAARQGERELTKPRLEALASELARAGHAAQIRIPDMNADRRRVIAGGLAVMLAVFDEFAIEAMRYCDGALCQGLIHDLLAMHSRATPGEPRTQLAS